MFGQREPGVVLADGRVVDGNRRFTCLRRIQRETREPQWFEAGDMALVVRFLCGQTYYGGFSTRTQDLPMTETETQGRKILMNGQIVILRNGVRYTILGTKLD